MECLPKCAVASSRGGLSLYFPGPRTGQCSWHKGAFQLPLHRTGQFKWHKHVYVMKRKRNRAVIVQVLKHQANFGLGKERRKEIKGSCCREEEYRGRLKSRARNKVRRHDAPKEGALMHREGLRYRNSFVWRDRSRAM